MSKENTPSTHTSFHNSGATNHDYSGSSGTQHEHPNVTRWENNPDANGTLYKDSDGVWRNEDGSVYKGGESK